jgi:DNA gyrase subunit A
MMFDKEYDDELQTVFHDEEEQEEKDGKKKRINHKEEFVAQSQIIDEAINDISPITITKEMKGSFLDYAMSVIISRALPNAYDGLKPVHRRILYAMSELGLDHTKPHKKSARIVGETMGKYHPHGDSSIYDAMVRMAQPFSMRYLLVEGHGNFGSVDGDEAAAMRYTEARLSKLSSYLLDGISKNAVDFVDNYDATEKEPVVLPARFPNLLISGSTGIAVGMATNIPPHNINEVIDGIIAYANNSEITIPELMQYIKGPDFPTAALILGTGGIKSAYETGNGSITIRSKSHIETHPKTGRQKIIITEIPFMINKARLIEKIAQLVKLKSIEGITALRDESNRKGIRIVFEIRRDAVAEVVLNKLFKLSGLQSNFGVNFIALEEGQPRKFNLKDAIVAYLRHQETVVTRKTRFDLEKAAARAHILDGLKIAINNIDEVIKMIRASSSDADAQQNLINAFELSPIQAKAITDMRLGRLTGLAIEKMDKEINELNILITNLNDILDNHDKLIALIIKELNEVKNIFGDERRTKIIEGVFGDINEADLIPVEDIAITLSSRGYVKRIALNEYRTQRRGGIGARSAVTYDDDDVKSIITTTTHSDLLIFTEKAKVFRIKSYKIPSLSKQAKGLPFLNLIDISKDDKVVTLLPIDNYEDGKYLMTITKLGIIKKTKISEYRRINKNGKYALGLKPGDQLLKAMVSKDEDTIIIGSKFGKVVRFHSSQVRSMGRTASGVKGINLSDDPSNVVVGADIASYNSKILSVGEKGYGKMTPTEDYRETKRGAKGVKTINVKKTGKLVSIAVVNGTEEIIVLTSKGLSIRTKLSQVSMVSRASKGVRIVRLDERVKIRSLSIINNEQIEEEVQKSIEKTQEMSMKSMTDSQILDINDIKNDDH